MFLKQSISKEALRYLLVVTGGFGVDFIVYATLVSWGESVYVANLAGFCIGAVFNVLLIRRFVFPDCRFRIGADLLLTVLANGTMLAVGMVVLWVLVDGLSINPYLAKLFANGLTFTLNYATRATFFSVK